MNFIKPFHVSLATFPSSLTFSSSFNVVLRAGQLCLHAETLRRSKNMIGNYFSSFPNRNWVFFLSSSSFLYRFAGFLQKYQISYELKSCCVRFKLFLLHFLVWKFNIFFLFFFLVSLWFIKSLKCNLSDFRIH